MLNLKLILLPLAELSKDLLCLLPAVVYLLLMKKLLLLNPSKFLLLRQKLLLLILLEIAIVKSEATAGIL